VGHQFFVDKLMSACGHPAPYGTGPEFNRAVASMMPFLRPLFSLERSLIVYDLRLFHLSCTAWEIRLFRCHFKTISCTINANL